MSVMYSVAGWIWVLLYIVAFVISLLGKHPAKIFFIIGFGISGFASFSRQVLYLFTSSLYGNTAWSIANVLLSLLSVGGFVVLIIGVAKALANPAQATAMGMPPTYGMVPGQPMAPPPGQMPPAGAPLCRNCGTPAAPGQPQCMRCGAPL